MMPGAIELEVTHTAALDRAVLADARALMVAVFGDDFDDADWDHALGGMHVIARLGEELVGHAAVVLRRAVAGGRTLRVGYVEAVGVHPAHQRAGIGTALMASVDPIVRDGHELGLLGTSDEGVALYRRAGWIPWRGPLAALTPDGVMPTPDEEGGVYALLTDGSVDVSAPLTLCDWRDGDLW